MDIENANNLVWFLLLNKIYDKLEGGMEQYLVLVVPAFLKCVNLQVSHYFFSLMLPTEISVGYQPSAGVLVLRFFLLESNCQV